MTARRDVPLAGTVTHGTVVWDGSNWVNQLLQPTSLASSFALPNGTTATTQSASDGSTKVATTAYTDNALLSVNAGIPGAVFQFGLHDYCNLVTPTIAVNSVGAGGVNAGRGSRVVMSETGYLRDVSVLIQTASGNSNIVITDTGQANATHTSRTVLAAKGSTATPTANTWFTYDPDLHVVQNQTLDLLWAADNTTAKVYSLNGSTGSGTMPNTSFLSSSGVGTTTQKLASNPGSIFQRVATDVITDVNFSSGDTQVMFVWRIAQS